jgi:fatty acid-binding protein DegV
VGRLAGLLGLCPLIELRANGEIRRLRPARGRRRALDRLAAAWRRTRVEDAHLHVVTLHVMARPEAEALLDEVRAETEPATALVADFGAVMAVHTGPGLVGLSWWWEQAG